MKSKTQMINELRQYRTSLGLCPTCGHREPEPDRRLCRPCLDREAARQRNRNASGRVRSVVAS